MQQSHAGPDPDQTLRVIVGLRARTLATTVEALRELSRGGPSLTVASLDLGPRLWQIENGVVEDRQSVRRAWVGDQAAYEIFQARYHEWSEKGTAFRLMSSMQFLTSFGVVPSVGGYVTRVGTGANGFLFIADRSRIGPWRMNVSALSIDGASLRTQVSVPPGGDATTYSMLMAVGREPTMGSLALFVPEARSAILFRERSPWEPVRLDVSSMTELIATARRDYGETLAWS